MTKINDKIDQRHGKAISEFRHACYPDADKDTIQTHIADVACHGFRSGIDYMETEHLAGSVTITREDLQSKLDVCIPENMDRFKRSILHEVFGEQK